jgi:hypothetical protein
LRLIVAAGARGQRGENYVLVGIGPDQGLELALLDTFDRSDYFEFLARVSCCIFWDWLLHRRVVLLV